MPDSFFNSDHLKDAFEKTYSKNGNGFHTTSTLTPAPEKRTRLKPLGDRIILLPDAPPGQTPAGLYVPDPSKHPPLTGTVIAVGDGLNAPKGGCKMELTPGDRVVYGKGSGVYFTGQDSDGRQQDYLIMRQSDVFMVLTDNDTA